MLFIIGFIEVLIHALLSIISCFQYMRSLRNFKLEQPHSHAMYFLYMLMFYAQWSKEELLAALEGTAFISHLCNLRA